MEPVVVVLLLAVCWRCGAAAALTKICQVTAAAQRDARQVAPVETGAAARRRLVEELFRTCQRWQSRVGGRASVSDAHCRLWADGRSALIPGIGGEM
ncbi:uncharacterized protein J3D65DRAFT_620061 [Phyllosticta citribraziliensis]|uniref:Secreted protein n=1 Tax=Phyllosticta citribraziliensis TaxID=989973 RepID=A0ABR1LXF0_9PEZI